ncbi:MAG: ATP synthase subunit I [Gammaproteobacteria bacterium]|nr:ATP synthase subunit I [Gammaproteobacteria bacterium]
MKENNFLKRYISSLIGFTRKYMGWDNADGVAGKIFMQIILLCVISLVFVFMKGMLGFKSVLLGGGAWIIPSLYFVYRLRRVKVTYDMKKILKIFLLSESVKLLLSFSIIALILLTCTIDGISFLSGYMFMALISLLPPFFCGIKND